jgi:hypothetical protein
LSADATSFRKPAALQMILAFGVGRHEGGPELDTLPSCEVPRCREATPDKKSTKTMKKAGKSVRLARK